MLVYLISFSNIFFQDFTPHDQICRIFKAQAECDRLTSIIPYEHSPSSHMSRFKVALIEDLKRLSSDSYMVCVVPLCPFCL